MTYARGSSQARSPAYRGLFAAALLVLLVGSAAPAQAAPPEAPGDSTDWFIAVVPDEVTVCPGSTAIVTVALAKKVWRTVNGKEVAGKAKTVAAVEIVPSLYDPKIVKVSPPSLHTSARRRILSGGARVSPIFALAQFTITAGSQPGDTSIYFKTSVKGKSVWNSVSVHVKCAFRVTLKGRWALPGEGSDLTANMLVIGAGLAPDKDGEFEVDAPMTNDVKRNDLICPGSASVGSPMAHFSGSDDLKYKLHIAVTFDPISTAGSESCKNRGLRSTATLDPLLIELDVSSGLPFYPAFSLPHTLRDSGRTFKGRTSVFIQALK